MALLDFLKRKKGAEKANPSTRLRTGKTVEKKSPKASVTKKIDAESQKSAPAPKSTVSKKAKGFSYSIVKEPHISEKATDLAENNKYTFKVYDNSNKPEIKKSVEGLYGVNVLNVNIIKIPSKKRRLGKTQGFKKGFSKAVVTIKEGQKIEIF